MTRESTILLLGLVTALAPFLGLPYSWLMVILPLAGFSIVILSVLLRARRMQEPISEPTVVSYEENSATA